MVASQAVFTQKVDELGKNVMDMMSRLGLLVSAKIDIPSEALMERPLKALLFTREPSIQNLVEQVCLIDGYRAVTVASIEAIEALIAQSGPGAFFLGVMDTAAFVTCDSKPPDWGPVQGQARVAAGLGLPLVFLGTRPSRRIWLARHIPHVKFLEKPVGPSALAAMMRTCLAR